MITNEEFDRAIIETHAVVRESTINRMTVKELEDFLARYFDDPARIIRFTIKANNNADGAQCFIMGLMLGIRLTV